MFRHFYLYCSEELKIHMATHSLFVLFIVLQMAFILAILQTLMNKIKC
jgi:hypothetical protein